VLEGHFRGVEVGVVVVLDGLLGGLLLLEADEGEPAGL
jgi:hypothetical protein